MKKIIPFVAVAVIVAVVAFYGGVFYARHSIRAGGNRQNFGNMSAAQRQQLMGQRGVGQGGVGGFGNSGGAGGEFLSGEIMSKDSNSLTLKLTDGGSKIIYVSSSTTNIMKSSTTTIGDLNIGQTVLVNANKNSEGTYTAKSIRLDLLPILATTTKK